jgi:hypothetical protein
MINWPDAASKRGFFRGSERSQRARDGFRHPTDESRLRRIDSLRRMCARQLAIEGWWIEWLETDDAA